jgi:hypothetical protein
MPYVVVKRGKKFVVKKKNGTKTFGSHTTRAKANAQMRALYAAERKKKR